MGKHELKQRETQVATNNGVGKEMEQTITVDDNCLPSPQELAAYKEIDPRIVDYLINASVKEQEHRHRMDNNKINIIRRSDRRDGRMNWWGMCFAFLSIVVMVVLAGYALYLDKPWFAGFMGASTLISIASIFINSNDSKGKSSGNTKK
ncbi:DUF2335 domain-containing protein [Bacteroides thetaiotaomicron]|uniref:DUF2335 domain-containing protein n=1 Tax=Bacteroides thetaiotaomicron TaxID=818 RepID=UPI002166BFA3|nr:DUF2335 domain-containing protein [Bacteroides thetaiotaomicron]MCS2294574.1 DUF2335 domain-containing protein [Bacteroides thetaiotaomicron]